MKKTWRIRIKRKENVGDSKTKMRLTRRKKWQEEKDE
jgi:hypothetical protein